MTKILKITCLTFFGVMLATRTNASEITGGLNTGLETGLGGTVVVAPTANVPAGTYTSAQSVSLAATGSQSIHYTTDGSVPACPSGNVYSAPITIGQSATLKAISCYPNNVSSTASEFAYVINLPAAPPPAAPTGGGGIYTPPPTYKTGDINKDNKIDKTDFATMMNQWGLTGTNTADLNNDKKVDKYDFALLMLNWGK